MFTRATRNFGVWRADHPATLGQGLGSSFTLVLAMATLAFAAWLTFFLVFKIRGDVYFFETSNIEIPDATEFKGSQILQNPRPAAVTVGILRNRSGQVTLLFDDGRSFHYPSQHKMVATYMRKRAQQLELTAMLTKSTSSSIGRMQIWSEKSLSFSVLQELTQVFSRMGFDEFDVAMTLDPRPSLPQSVMIDRARL